MTELLQLIDENRQNTQLLRDLDKIFKAKKNELEYLSEVPDSEQPTLVSHFAKHPQLTRYSQEVREAVASQMVYYQALMTAGREVGTYNAVMTINMILKHITPPEEAV